MLGPVVPNTPYPFPSKPTQGTQALWVAVAEQQAMKAVM